MRKMPGDTAVLTQKAAGVILCPAHLPGVEGVRNASRVEAFGIYDSLVT